MLDFVGSGVQTDATDLQFRVQAGRPSSQFLREYQRRGYLAYVLRVFLFSLASVLVFLLPFLGDVIISYSISLRSTSCSAIIMIIFL